MPVESAELPFLVFGAPQIDEAEIDEVVACMRSGWLGTGPRVAQFERDFAAWRRVQPEQVAAVNSCTAALHGMSKDAWHRFGDAGYKHYQVVECGFKYNMMDLQAAIGLHQLARVEPNWQRRRELWLRYDAAFAGLPIGLPAAPEADTRHGHHLYTVMIDAERCGLSRDAFLDAMNAARIGTGVHYLSIPEHPYYQQRFGWRPEQWPHAMRLGRQTVSLPLSPAMTDADVGRVIEAVRRIVGHAS